MNSLALSLALGYPGKPTEGRTMPGDDGISDSGRPVLSASQVDTFRECARKWAWRYLEGIKEPPNASANLGTKCHSMLEKWLELGAYPDTLEAFPLLMKDGHTKIYFPGQIVQAGLHFLPPPGIALVEGEFRMESRRSSWTGYRDAQFLEDEKTGEAFAPDPVVAQIPGLIPIVLDHKTTSDFKWMKSAEVLRRDIQAVLYAAKTMEDMAVRRVKNRWVYYRTTGQPSARKVEVEFTVDQVAEEMASIDATAQEVHQLYQLRPKALELAPNPEACERYGGCPHISRCNLGTVERMEALMAKETIQEMMERKKREREALEASGAPPAVAPPAPPAPPMAPPAVQAPPAPPMAPPAVQAPPAPPIPPAPQGIPQAPNYWKPGDPMNVAQEYLQAKGASLSIIASAADVPPPDHVAKAYDAGGWMERGTINPPEAPPAAPPTPALMPPAPPVVQTAATQVVDDLTAMNRDQLKVLAMQMGLVDSSSRLREGSLQDMIRDARAKGWTAPPAPLAPPAPPAPLAPPAPPAVAPPAPPAPPAVAPPAPPAPPVIQSGDTSGVQAGRGFLLLVNAVPMRGLEEGITLDSILAEAVLPRMRADTGLPDYRLEDFGRGPGRLAAYLEGFLQELQFGPETTIVVDSRTDEGRACLSTLTRYAGTVIRGV
jgi:hypothetical protein